MALSLRNNKQRGSLGLDIDDRYMAAVLVDGRQVLRMASTDLPTGLVEEGEVADVEGLSRAIRDFFKAEQLPSRVRLGVANQMVSVRRLDLPRIENADELATAVRFQAADAIAMPLDDAVLDFQVTGSLPQADGSPARMEVTVAAARREMVGKLAESVAKAGLKAEGIDLDAFAIVRMYAEDEPQDAAMPGTARVYCHLAGVTNLAIAIGSTCVFTRSLAAGWESGSESDPAVLADEIRLSTDYYMSQPGAQWPHELLLCGPGARTAGVAEAVAERIGMPVTCAEPLGSLQLADGATGSPERHTVAAGLAIGAQS